jgi:methionyl-tRNA formyltransferase
LLVEVLPAWIEGKIKPIPQSNEQASYAGKIPKDLYQIKWNRSAEEIVRQVKAFAPCPGAFGYFHQKRLKVIKAHVYKQKEKFKPDRSFAVDTVFNLEIYFSRRCTEDVLSF